MKEIDQYFESLDTRFSGQISTLAELRTTLKPIVVFCPFSTIPEILVTDYKIHKISGETIENAFAIGLISYGNQAVMQNFCLGNGWDLDGSTGRINRFFKDRTSALSYLTILKLIFNDVQIKQFARTKKKQTLSTQIDPFEHEQKQ